MPAQNKVEVELGMQINELVKALKDAKGQVSGFAKNTDSAFKKVNAQVNKMHSGIKKVFTSFPAKLGLIGGAAGLGALTKSFVGARMEMEKYDTEFEVLMGGMKQGKELLAKLSNFAATTPFQLPQVIRAGKQLQNFGMMTEANLRLVGDAASAVGQPIDELSMWFGRLYDGIKSGRPVGEAAQRLQELALISGPTRTKIEQMQKAGADGTKIWEMFTQSMGKFSGMMEKKSHTMAGMISNLKDLWFQFKVKVGDGIFNALKGDIDSVLAKVNEWSSNGKLAEWADRLGQKIKNTYEIIAGVFKFISSHWDILTSVAMAIGSIIVAVESWTAVQTILNVVMSANPIGAIIMGIGLLVTAINYVVKKTIGWAGVWDVVKKGAGTFWEYLKAIGGSIKDWVVAQATVFKNLGAIISDVFTLNFAKIKDDFKALVNTPKDFVNSVQNRFSEAGTDAVAIWKKTKEKIEKEVVKPKVKLDTGGKAPTAGGHVLSPAEMKKIAKAREAADKKELADIVELNKIKADLRKAEADERIKAEERRVAEEDYANEQRKQKIQNMSSFIQQSLQPVSQAFTDTLNGMGANWNQVWDQMKNYWMNSFFNSMIKGLGDLVAATIFGENVKRKEMLKTAATAIASGAKEAYAALKSAAASIYSAIAKIAEKLSFLGPFAIPAIIAAGAGVVALFSKFKKTLGLAVGTKITKPTAALLGEAGPEIVAPEKDFLTYSRELVAGVMNKISQVAYEIQRPIIENMQEITMMQSLAGIGPIDSLRSTSATNRESQEETLHLLRQIAERTNVNIEVQNQIKGEDLYQVVKKQERKKNNSMAF